ncbi:MAG: class I SAM-dependent methyltransferase [Proteobacteria bacterium]|nr:class I SAM-dependent methyltransferase [Pseudomonadota bacterium]
MNNAQVEHERFLAAFNQNSEHFRSLNSLMWQVPLIAMTLTGGLWFGVSTTPTSKFIQVCLLGLAAFGNLSLLIALSRIRFIMARYLKWFESNYQSGFVKAEGDGRLRGDGLFTGKRTVQRVFQAVMAAAATISAILLIVTGVEMYLASRANIGAIGYYDRHATELADAYETVTFERAHPELVAPLAGKTALRILDVGAGTGRDAVWAAARGHIVSATEPSGKMLQLARSFHPSAKVSWLSDSLPALAKINDEQFELIILSAVWMHISPKDRADALHRLERLLSPSGVIYLTLRLGPPDEARELYNVSFEELQGLAGQVGLSATILSEGPDLLLRNGIRWKRVMLVREGEKAALFQETP